MKILVVSFFALEETTPRAFRAKSLYKALRNLGHEVEFISARENSKLEKNVKLKQPASKIRRIVRSTIGGVLSKLLPDGKNFFEAMKLIFEVKSKNVDLTISIGLPFTVHLATWLAIKSNRLETSYAVADYGDPYSTNPISKKPLYARGLERIILKEFNYVTVPIESSAVAYENILVPAGKIKVIPQGFDLEADYSQNYKKNPIPSFAFAGALYKKIRDPSAFLDFLTQIEGDYVFHIYTDLSNSHTISILEPYISKLAGRMKLHAKIPRDECLEILSRMDFLIPDSVT